MTDLTEAVTRLVNRFVEKGNNADLNMFAREKQYELACIFQTLPERVIAEFGKHRWPE